MLRSRPSAAEGLHGQDMQGRQGRCGAEEKTRASAPPCASWVTLHKSLASLCLFCFISTKTALPWGEHSDERKKGGGHMKPMAPSPGQELTQLKSFPTTPPVTFLGSRPQPRQASPLALNKAGWERLWAHVSGPCGALVRTPWGAFLFRGPP